jgi:hypothetical protein
MMKMEGSGINQTLAQQFFDDLAGHMQVCDVPPEKSEQTMRIKVSSTPWVVPTTVDRRLAGTAVPLPLPLKSCRSPCAFVLGEGICASV